MKKIKICFVISNLFSGGAERQFVELIKHINKDRFEVYLYLYAVNRGIFYNELEHEKDILVKKDILKSKLTPFKVLEAIVNIFRFLSKHQFDIIQTTLHMNGVLVRMAAPRRYKNKIVSTVRTSFNLYSKFQLFLEKILIRKSFVVTNSISAANLFRNYFNSKYQFRISTIYNGFDTSKFYPYNQYRNSPDINVGNIGRIDKIKNQIQLVRVLPHLNDKRIRLLLIGKNNLKNEVSALINKLGLNNRVVVFDELSNVTEYYHKFDIYVVSSVLEGCPNALFEAMLCKCFCIISKNANIDNYIINNVNGLVYNGTDECLIMKLNYAVSIYQTSTYNEIVERGYLYAYNNFSMAKMVKSYEDLYGSILNRY